MSQKLQFLGAYIRHVDLRRKDTEDFARMDISCALTAKLATTLECPEAQSGDKYKRMKLDIEEIPLSSLHLTMKDLEQYDLNIPAHSLRDFAAVRVEDGDGPVDRELRFHILVAGKNIAQIREYWAAIGSGKGRLTVTTQAEQTSLPADGATKQ